jgi:hypothetical protein
MDSRPGFKECSGIGDGAGVCGSRHGPVPSVCPLGRTFHGLTVYRLPGPVLDELINSPSDPHRRSLPSSAASSRGMPQPTDYRWASGVLAVTFLSTADMALTGVFTKSELCRRADFIGRLATRRSELKRQLCAEPGLHVAGGNIVFAYGSGLWSRTAATPAPLHPQWSAAYWLSDPIASLNGANWQLYLCFFSRFEPL